MKSTTHHLRALLIALAIATSAAHAQSRDALTPESLAAAMADGRGAGLFRASVIAQKVNRQDFRLVPDSPADAGLALTLLRQAPFSVTLLTPYARAAVTAADARRRFAEVPRLVSELLNAEGIVVSIDVGPQFVASAVNDAVVAELSASIKLNPRLLDESSPVARVPTPMEILGTGDSIQNVVLRVGPTQEIIRPFKTALESRTVTNGLGGSRIVTVGTFYFKLTDFDRLPLALVCVGEKGTFTLLIDRSDLAP
jgi:hypothetical protein